MQCCLDSLASGDGVGQYRRLEIAINAVAVAVAVVLPLLLLSAAAQYMRPAMVMVMR